MNLSRRAFLHWSAAALIGPAGTAAHAPRKVAAAPDAPDAISHALARLSFGPRPHDRAALLELHPDADEAARRWIAQQLRPADIPDDEAERAVRRFEELRWPAPELFELKPDFVLEQLTAATLLRATLSERALNERLVHFWLNHFNVCAAKEDCRWLIAAYERDAIRPHALGSFRDLLKACSLHPAMLWFLDGRANRADSSHRPNENFARELFELHTLGVDGGYSQRDVMEAARCLSGWTVPSRRERGRGTVQFDPSRHDDGSKRVLGRTLPAGGGPSDLDALLDLVAFHPATARHIARKLCTHFIADDPPEPAVHSVARSFLESRGSIADALAALTQSTEFWAGTGGKFRRPFEFIVAAVRASHATLAKPHLIQRLLEDAGHAPFQYLTPEGWPDTAAPWLPSLAWRWSCAARFARESLSGVRLDAGRIGATPGGLPGWAASILGRALTPDERAVLTLPDAEPSHLFALPAFQWC